MRRLYNIILLFCLPGILPAQQESFTIFDTVQLEEIRIAASVPLNERTVLDFHQSSNFSSIDRINERLDGIMLIRRGAYAMDPQMHGFSAGQINVTIDGMKMFGACTDRMDPVTSYLEPDNLKTLKINHGTAGNINGNTVGGSFDMLLREPAISQNPAFSITAGTGYETASNGVNANAAFELSREKWAFRSSGTYRNHDSYRAGDGNIVPFSQFSKVNLHSVFKYEPDPNNIIRLDFLLDDAFDVGYSALPMDVARAQARMFSVEYRKPLTGSKLSNLKTKLYYNSVYHLMDDSSRDSTFLLEGNAEQDTVYMRMDMPGWSDTWGFYLETEVELGERSSLFFKLDDYLNFSRANMTMYMNSPSYPGEPPMYAETWPDQYRNVMGLYASYTNQITDNLRMGLDTRIDYSITRVTSETGWRQFAIFGYDINKPYYHLPVSLNFNLGFRPDKAIALEGGLGYSERLPTNSEQFGFFLYNALDGYDYLGNPDIKPEGSAEAWTRIRFTRPDFKVSLQGTLSHVSDYIIGMVDPDIPRMNLYATGLKRYRNIQYANLFSTGLQVHWSPVNQISIYSLSKYTYGVTNNGEALPLIPPLKNFSIMRFQEDRFSIQVEGEFSSAQNRTSESFGETPTPAFAIFHLRATWMINISNHNLELGTGVENVFDKAYSEHLDWGNYLRPGRNIYLNLSILM
jgi:iron complex outermembrane receptor protein